MYVIFSCTQNNTLCVIHLSNPKHGHTTGGSGPGGAWWGGAARRGWAGQDADGSVRPGDNRPSYPPRHRTNLFWTSLQKHEQGNPMWTDRGKLLVGHSLFAFHHRHENRSSFLAADQWIDAFLSPVNPFHAGHVRKSHTTYHIRILHTPTSYVTHHMKYVICRIQNSNILRASRGGATHGHHGAHDDLRLDLQLRRSKMGRVLRSSRSKNEDGRGFFDLRGRGSKIEDGWFFELPP